jgi:hypothetical protein
MGIQFNFVVFLLQKIIKISFLYNMCFIFELYLTFMIAMNKFPWTRVKYKMKVPEYVEILWNYGDEIMMWSWEPCVSSCFWFSNIFVEFVDNVSKSNAKWWAFDILFLLMDIFVDRVSIIFKAVINCCKWLPKSFCLRITFVIHSNSSSCD